MQKLDVRRLYEFSTKHGPSGKTGAIYGRFYHSVRSGFEKPGPLKFCTIKCKSWAHDAINGLQHGRHVLTIGRFVKH